MATVGAFVVGAVVFSSGAFLLLLVRGVILFVLLVLWGAPSTLPDPPKHWKSLYYLQFKFEGFANF